MKKRIIPILTVALSLLCASVCDAYYLLRLKNRGMVTTPAYWFEGNKIHFYVSGGIASLERREIDKIEDLEKEVSDYRQRTAAIQVKKETPSAPPAAEKAKEPEKPPDAKNEKVDLNAFKEKKTQMTAELDDLLLKQREAAARGDNEAKEKTLQEIRNISGEIYKLTDEVKEKNKGQLPNGWWDK